MSQKKKSNILEDYLNNQPYVPGYLTDQKTNIETQLKNLDMQKYNSNGTVKSNWTDQQEQNYVYERSKLQQDLNNTNAAFNQYMNAEQLRQQGLAQQDIIRQQGQKYLGGELQAYGMGNVGTSESSRIGLANAYGRNVAAINQEVGTAQQNILADYMSNMTNADSELAANKLSTLKEYQDVAYQDAYNTITNLMDKGNETEVLAMLDRVKNSVSAEQYNNLMSYYNLTKNSLAYDTLNKAYGSGATEGGLTDDEGDENKIASGDLIIKFGNNTATLQTLMDYGIVPKGLTYKEFNDYFKNNREEIEASIKEINNGVTNGVTNGVNNGVNNEVENKYTLKNPIYRGVIKGTYTNASGQHSIKELQKYNIIPKDVNTNKKLTAYITENQEEIDKKIEELRKKEK